MTPDSRHLGEPGVRGPKDICPVQPLPVTPLLILLIEQTDPLLKRGRSSRTPLSCPFPLLLKREGLVLLWNAESRRGHNLRSVLGVGGWSQGVMGQRAEGAQELQWDQGRAYVPGWRIGKGLSQPHNSPPSPALPDCPLFYKCFTNGFTHAASFDSLNSKQQHKFYNFSFKNEETELGLRKIS